MRNSRKALITAALSATLVVGAVAPGFASSHREAPLTAADPQIDNTDVYAFVSPDVPDTVTLIANWIPFQNPAGGPNFFPFADGAHYDINIDNTGSAKPDIIYRWTFSSSYQNPNTFLYNTGPVRNLTDPTLNFRQTYKLEEIRGAQTRTLVNQGRVAPSFVGNASMPNYRQLRQQAITNLDTGSGKTFAGQADDPFFLDLRVFDLLYGANLKEAGHDTLNGFNVNTIALQVPRSALTKDGNNPIIGVWSTTSRQSIRTQTADGKQAFTGDFVQVSRLGNPLVNEVVAPVGAKDLFNSSKPENDSQFLPAVQYPEVPKLIEAIYKIKAPATPRNDLVSVFLTGVKGLNQPANVKPSEELRLNTSIPRTRSPKRLGVLAGDNAGFPNGRRLADDVVDIELQVLEGALVGRPNKLGDGVDKNDVPFESHFPYVALPHSGSVVGKVKGTRFSANSAPVGSASAGEGGTAPHGMPVLPLAAGGAAAMLALGIVVSRRKAGITA
ncbi:MAG: DUF4331 domain-containing protein [Actinomycetota bacterium]